MPTATAYEKIDALPMRSRLSADTICAALARGNISDTCAELYNIFEQVTPYPREIKEIMMRCGAVGVLMSGSGPSIFGIFPNEAKAHSAASALTDCGIFAVSVVPCEID